MDTDALAVKSKSIKGVKIRAIPGHFATNHSHVNFYVDLTDAKIQHKMAKLIAANLAGRYGATFIDTIVCLEGTEMVGAFLADSLSQPGMAELNSGIAINVLAPENNTNGQLIFRENMLGAVRGKNILLLLAFISTGQTAKRAVNCLKYYDGHLAGICAMFSVATHINNFPVSSVFTNNDIPNYKSSAPGDCPMCAAGQKIDAISNSFGYSKLQV